jgi:Ca-activated chloride channel family protein
MTVTDVPPDRLRFSARYASLLVDRMGKTPCGVVLVKGDAVLAIPLTDDRRSVLDLFDSLSPALVSAPGSGLSSGIRVALAAFPDNIAASRTIILITDGDETSGALADAARKVRSDGVKLVIVGAGTSGGAEINVFPGSNEPRMQVTRLREDVLKSAARTAGNGSFYVNGLDTGSALRVLDAIAPAGGSGVQLVYSPKPVYRYAGFLLVALCFFSAGCVAGGLSCRKKN